MTVPDDEVPAAAHGPGLPIVRKGSGGLPAPILRLPLAQLVCQATGIGCLVVISEEAFWQSLGGRTFRREVE